MNAHIELAQISYTCYPAGFEFERNDNIGPDEDMCYPEWDNSVEELPNGNLKALVPICGFEIKPFGQSDGGQLYLEMEQSTVGNEIYFDYFKEWAATIDRLFTNLDVFSGGQFIGVFEISYEINYSMDGEEYDSEVAYKGVLDMSKLELLNNGKVIE